MNALVTTNGGSGTAVPPSPTVASTQESASATTHTKDTAALCRFTTGEVPPPLIGSTSTCTLMLPLISIVANMNSGG